MVSATSFRLLSVLLITTASAASPCRLLDPVRERDLLVVSPPLGSCLGWVVVSATSFRLLSVLLTTTASAASPPPGAVFVRVVAEGIFLVGPPPLSSIGSGRGGGDLLGRQRGEDDEVVPLLLEVLLPIDEDSAFRSKNAF